ncbi:MAG: hypothetical protein J5935_04515 [Lachnospiraceae bacterium]|nr:hypothetical protein [Lachnospiraceae bacterium]
MTSKNSSSTEKTMTFIQKQKSISRRRLVLWVLSCLYFFTAHILGTLMILVANRPGTNPERMRKSMLDAFSTYLGTRYPIWFFVIIIAAVLGIQGFAYLYDQRKVDFYENQPIARKDRFFTIYINGILIYVLPCLVSLALAIIILMVNGFFNMALLADILYGAIRVFILFLGIYHVSMIASFLTGNVVMAGMMTAFLLLVEPVTRLLLEALRSTFFKTYFADTFAFDIMLNPVYNYIIPGQWGSSFFSRVIYENRPGELLAHVASMRMGRDIVALVVIAATLFIAYLLYQKRRNEMSSVAIAFEGIKPVLKLVVGVLGALCCGMIIRSLFGFTGGGATWFTVLIIILAGIVICCFAEVIYDMNIHAMFRHAWHIPVVVGLSLFLFFVFRLDLFGYDRKVPDASDIQSGALVLHNINNNVYDENLDYIEPIDFAQKYMFLEDAEAIAEIGAIGQEQYVNTMNGQTEGNYRSNGWQGLLTYRLKGGWVITRRIEIPYDVDEALLNRLMGTEEYKEGTMMVYQDEAIRALEGSETGIVKLVYTDGILERGIQAGRTEELYSRFAECYRKDLEQFDFSLLRKGSPVGVARIDVTEMSTDPYGGGQYVWLQFPVYREYTHTLNFLKTIGVELPTDNALRAEEVMDARVEWHEEIADEDGNVNYAYRVVSYSDKEMIEQFLEKVRPHDLLDAWSGEESADEYSVSFTINTAPEGYSGERSGSIRREDLPAGVLKDLENAVPMQ